jgi:hypothetical protein
MVLDRLLCRLSVAMVHRVYKRWQGVVCAVEYGYD